MITAEHQKAFEKKAKELGANSSRLISARDIVVEKRTVLKCIFGCDGWGSRVCPPFIPDVKEFRDMLKEYDWALLVDWRSGNALPKGVSENFIKLGTSFKGDPALQEAFDMACKNILRERKEIIQPGILELEKLAWTLGYNTALATFPGKCAWCVDSAYSRVNCGGRQKECNHPTLRRPCLMGLGIRLDKTLKKQGLNLPAFPIEGGIPKQYTLLLIE